MNGIDFDRTTERRAGHPRRRSRGDAVGRAAQRVCLARALLADADILVLDDTTSALDARTNRRAINNIRALRNGRSPCWPWAAACRSP